jgi:hypothetical protein
VDQVDQVAAAVLILLLERLERQGKAMTVAQA